MTSRPDPSDLASDLADGLLSGEEAARAAATPGVAARVEEIHRLRAALREVPPAPELPKARTLAAAVEAGMDAHHGAAGSSGRGGWQPWLAAAAIVAVVVLGIGVLTLRDTGDEDVTASSEMAEDQGSSAEADDSSGSDQDSESVHGAEAPPAPADSAEEESLSDDGRAQGTAVDLGPVADENELVAAIAAADRGDRAAEPDPAAEPQPGDAGASAGETAEGSGNCPQLTATGDPQRGESSLFATATLDGEPVWVHLYSQPEQAGTSRLVATSSACVDVIDRIVPDS